VAKPHRHNTRQTKFNRPRTRPYTPNGLGGGSLSRFLPGRSGPTDADAGQTDVPSTRHSEMSERPVDVPQPRSGWLSSRSTDDSVNTTPLQADGPGSGSSRGPIGTHSCCCLRRRPRRQPTYSGSRSRPASRRNTLRSPGNSTLEPQFPAASGGSTHDAKLH